MSKKYFFAIVLLNIFLSVGCDDRKMTDEIKEAFITSTSEPVGQPLVVDPPVVQPPVDNPSDIVMPPVVQSSVEVVLAPVPEPISIERALLDGDNTTNAAGLDNSTESVPPAPFVAMNIDDLNRILALHEEIPNDVQIQQSIQALLKQGNKLIRALKDITDPNGHVDLAQGCLAVYSERVVRGYGAENLDVATPFSCEYLNNDCEFVIVQ